MRSAVLLAVAVLVVSIVGSGEGLATTGPPRIVPWSEIGSAGLGMQRSAVEYRLGPTAGEAGSNSYVVPGGRLAVGFAGDRVSFVSTDSSYFETPDGIKVGTAIPLGRCHRTRSNRCEHRWNGFVLGNSGLSPFWEREGCFGGVPAVARLSVRIGVIESISVAYGGSGNGCGTRSRYPLSVADRAAISEAIRQSIKGVNVYRVSGFRHPKTSNEYAAASVSSRDLNTGEELQGALVIVRKRAGVWRVVTYGSAYVGCGDVPIKPLAEMGGMDCNFG